MSYSYRSERNFSSTGFYLNSGGYTLQINANCNNNWDFQYPNATGSTSDYLVSGGGSATVWSFTGPTGFRPVAVDDFYRCRTNEGCTINLISGVTGNSGGIDTSGVSGFNLVIGPSRGTITATGSTGSYVYRSWPRWTGIDFIKYTVTDSSGVTSNIGLCEISVEASGIQADASGPSGPYFTFVSRTGAYYFRGSLTGTTSIFFATVTPNHLGVSRNDNLIYYSNEAGDPNIYAHDYINGFNFTVFNGTTNPRFLHAPVTNWDAYACCYDQRTNVIYLCTRDNDEVIYKVALNPYVTNGTTGTQNVAGVSKLGQPGSIFSDISMDSRNDTLIRTDTDGSYHIICPTSQYVYKNGTVPGIAGSSQVCLDQYNNIIYKYVSSGQTIISYLDISNNSIKTITSISQNVYDINDLGDFLNDPIS